MLYTDEELQRASDEMNALTREAVTDLGQRMIDFAERRDADPERIAMMIAISTSLYVNMLEAVKASAAGGRIHPGLAMLVKKGVDEKIGELLPEFYEAAAHGRTN
jgi:hypothetical protein